MNQHVLIIIAQHAHLDTDHMLEYQLGSKPINSIWIHYYHLKHHLETKKIPYTPININSKNFNLKKIPKKTTTCISLFNDPNGFKKHATDNLVIIRKIKEITKCKFLLITEIVTDETHDTLSKIFDTIFTNRTCNYKKCISLGFAANHERLLPQKQKDTLRILIDHPAYNKTHFIKKDKTKFIIKSIFSTKFDKQLIIRRFVNGDIESVCNKDTKVELYNRKGINILNAYDEYNHADIFFVTHPESMGMSVIESAMSGCLIAIPKDYIKSDFLSGINYVEFTDTIDWKLILSKLNAKLSRKLALRKTWTIFFDKILAAASV